MSLSNIINIATSGVLAQQTAIAATSENIANITTPDFSRREVQFQSDAIPGQFSGVTVEVARAAGNSFLQESVFLGNSDVAGLSASAEALSRVVGSLGETGDNISFEDRASEAVAALARLNANPSSPAAQAEAVSLLEATFTAFQQTQNVITSELDRANTGLGFDIDRANTLLSEIFTLNNQIASGGNDSNGPADAVTAHLSELSGLLNINVARDEIGRATVTTGEGRLLVNATGFGALSVVPGVQPSVNVTGISSQPDAQNDAQTDITSEVSGGTIGGALALVNSQLPAISTLLRQTEADFANALNAVASANTSFPPPQILSSTTLPTDAQIAGLSGQSTLAVINDAGILTGRVDLDFDANTIAVNGGVPVSFAATTNGFVQALNSALGTSGTATINDGVLTLETITGEGLAFADDNAGLANSFGFNQLVGQSETGFSVVQSILDNPSGLGTARLSLNGAAIGTSVTSINDGTGAAALFEAGRGQAAQLASAVGQIGAEANAAAGRASVAQAFSDDVNARLLEESGVNLEEELSNLILFQRAFNANARILSVADELYQSIIALI